MAERISVAEARRHLQANPNALLVCAYDSDEKFRQNRLDGAISLADFQGPRGGFCRRTGRSSSTVPDRTRRHPPVGRTSTGPGGSRTSRRLEGGVNAWHEAAAHAAV